MPIYEYRCTDCGHQSEYLQKVSEAPMTTCPSCGSEGLRKLLSAAGFQLKGSGWYATDFKGAGRPADAKGESKDEAKGESAGESKGESKGDAKAQPAKAAPAATPAAAASGN